MLALEPIGDSERRDEEEYQAALDRAAPQILGALLDGVVAGLRDIATTKIAGKPRMADFAIWAEAATRAYWPEGTFLQAYRENIASAVELVLEASAVGDAVRTFMASKTEWAGTASVLLPLLTPLIPEQAARERGWPKRAADLGGKLRRVAPALRRTGIQVTFHRGGHAMTRSIRIEKQPSASSAPSASSVDASKSSGLGVVGRSKRRQHADSVQTAQSAAAVCTNRLKTHAADSADSADSILHPSGGNGGALELTVDLADPCDGPVSDVDAVLAELAARRDKDGAS
jgi:hypothetical protein